MYYYTSWYVLNANVTRFICFVIE